MLHKTRNLTCLIFANGVSHFCKRHQISPNWHDSTPRPWKTRPRILTWNGTPFPPTTPSGNHIPFCDPILGHTFRQAPQPETVSHSERKFRDTLSTCSPTGNYIPFLDRIMGRNFPLERLWESVPHFERPEWDALSAKHLNGKLCPIPKANSGTHFPKACPSGKPVPLWTHPGTEPSTYQAFHQ